MRDTPPVRLINSKGHGLTARAYRLLREEDQICMGFFGGTVIETTEDTITVRWWGEFPRTLEASVALASKRIPLVYKPFCGHRLNQVRAGDFVGIYLAHTPRGPVVLAIGIQRRWGGTIPPAEDEHLPERGRLHNIFNAKQTAEEKVLPKLGRMLARIHR